MTTTALRRSAGLVLTSCGLALAGCSSGPTYGTGVSQGQQLFNDIDGVFSLGGSSTQQISYAPRPELVRPASIGQLPPPRTGVAVAANDPNWPQSPEVLRARQLAAAEATSGGSTLPPDFNPSTGTSAAREPDAVSPTNEAAQDRSWLSPLDLRRQSRQAEARRVAQQAAPTERRYLSDPPVAYRQPAASAPVGDLGVDEEIKQRRATGTRPLGERIRDALPF